MRLKFLWPGRTKNEAIRALQEDFLRRISRLATCQLMETREAKGIEEKFAKKILELEAEGLEKHLEDDYIICLFDQGQEMNSMDFARFMENAAMLHLFQKMGFEMEKQGTGGVYEVKMLFRGPVRGIDSRKGHLCRHLALWPGRVLGLRQC